MGTGRLSRVFTIGYEIDDWGGFGLGETRWSHIGRTGGSLSLSPPTNQNFYIILYYQNFYIFLTCFITLSTLALLIPVFGNCNFYVVVFMKMNEVFFLVGNQ
jgi:hypothetical protein